MIDEVKQFHHNVLDKLINDTAEYLHKDLDKAIASGALPDELTGSMDARLARLVYYVASSNHQMPLSTELKKEARNLSHFI